MLQKRNKIVIELATTLKKLTARAIFSLLPTPSWQDLFLH